jgi:hypothetical protein
MNCANEIVIAGAKFDLKDLGNVLSHDCARNIILTLEK